MNKLLQFGKEKAKAEGLEIARSREASHITGFYRHAEKRGIVPVSEHRTETSMGLTECSQSNRVAATPQKTEGSGMRLLTAEEAAVYLRVSYSMLAHWRHENKGPRVTKIGRNVRYREADLTAFLEGSNGSQII